jgi:hypothetical protein
VNCSTVTIINCPGDIAGRPDLANTATNRESEYTSPSTSRIRIARFPFGNDARATCTVNAGVSGHGNGSIDIPTCDHTTRRATTTTSTEIKPL